ncbi:Cytochrome P450 [Mycena kentingensis (nom. inval.)]|nr:Cytochrome P450 [Mycena kentingensis (nom. inval.)]
MSLAYDEELGVAPEGWTAIPAKKVFASIITRVSNRVFVGARLCRDPTYRNLLDGFSDAVMTAGAIIRMAVPSIFRPLVGWLFRAAFGHHRKMVQLVAPEIAERRRRRTVDATAPMPNDMLTWLMEQPSETGTEHSCESLAMRLLNVNFVALHSTTHAFMHAFYNLASKPEFIPVLREEVEAFLDPLEPSSWTKESIFKCAKLDSFLKETLRLHGLGAIWMPRLTLAPFKYSDGTVIAPGDFVGTAVYAIHEDDSNYANAKEFDPLRFVNSGSGEDGLLWTQKLTGTSPSYLTFGSGRHICPGRFFASV